MLLCSCCAWLGSGRGAVQHAQHSTPALMQRTHSEASDRRPLLWRAQRKRVDPQSSSSAPTTAASSSPSPAPPSAPALLPLGRSLQRLHTSRLRMNLAGSSAARSIDRHASPHCCLLAPAFTCAHLVTLWPKAPATARHQQQTAARVFHSRARRVVAASWLLFELIRSPLVPRSVVCVLDRFLRS